MNTALQDVSNASAFNFAPARNRVDLSGEVRALPAAPSAIVVLGAALRPPLTYDASGRLEAQAGTTNAITAAQISAAAATSDVAQSALFVSATASAQVDLAGIPSRANLIANLTSPPTVALAPDFAVTPLPLVPGAPDSDPAVTLEPPVTPDIVVALSNTFNPLSASTTDIAPLITSGPALPPTLTGAIANTIPNLAGEPNTASFTLPLPIAAALPAATEDDAATLLSAAANAFAPTTPNDAAESTTEQTATAARLAESASPDTRIITPEPTTTTIAATAQVETVLTAPNVAGGSTVIAASNGVGAPTAPSTDAVPPAIPVAAGPIAVPGAAPPVAPSVPGAAVPGVTDAPAAPAQAPTAARESGILTSDDIVRNPFYPAMAASLYLNAMIFRLQQSSAAELNSPADNVQMVGDVRAVTAMHFDGQGPADDFRNRPRTFA